MNPNFIPLEAISTRPFDLDSIQIATPCRADWNMMSGDDKTRHCKACAKNVYNLSALTRDEAVRLIREKEGNLCVQLHRRADGTIISSDCTVGISHLKKSGRIVQSLVFGAIAAILGVFGVSNSFASRQNDAASVQSGGMMLGAPPMLGEIAPVRGKIKVAPPKTTKKPGKTNGNTSSKSARKPKIAPTNRRPR